MRSLYGIALVPDLVIYLRVSPAQLVERNFRKNSTLDYWEAGMDLGLSRDIFDSFMRYQKLIQKEFNLMQREYGFHVVNGNRSFRSVSREITTKVEGMLGL
jgi:dTMP kinase